MQGRESDVAIFSVTRSNSEADLGFIGPDYWRRINVALSRARFGLTIVGDAGFIKGTTGALKKVLSYVETHSGRLRAQDGRAMSLTSADMIRRRFGDHRPGLQLSASSTPLCPSRCSASMYSPRSASHCPSSTSSSCGLCTQGSGRSTRSRRSRPAARAGRVHRRRPDQREQPHAGHGMGSSA